MNPPTHESYLALKKRIEKIRFSKRRGYKIFYLARLREVFWFVRDYTSAKLEKGLKQRVSFGKEWKGNPNYINPDVMHGEPMPTPVSNLCWGGNSDTMDYQITLWWVEGKEKEYWEFSIRHRVNINYVDLDKSLLQGQITADARDAHSLVQLAKYLIDLEATATRDFG
jgi:hypothetical protein